MADLGAIGRQIACAGCGGHVPAPGGLTSARHGAVGVDAIPLPFSLAVGGTVTGTAASTLPTFTQSATGNRTIPTVTGSAASTLAAFGQSAAGTFAPLRTGTATSTLGLLTQAATGTSTPPTWAATASSALPLLTQQATGSHTGPTFTAAASSTLGSLTTTATGTIGLSTFSGSASSGIGGGGGLRPYVIFRGRVAVHVGAGMYT